MANPKFAWGIDIGNRALKAIKLVREGDSIRVDDFDVIEHETVLSNSGDNRETYIVNALTAFSQRHPMKGGAVSVGVSGQASFARFIKLPPVEPKKIPEIVRFEAIQQIPFPLDDVEWSYQLFQSPESPDVEVGIFAMRKELLNQQIKFFTDADMNVQVVQMSPLAVYNAMSYDQRVDGTTMIIDLGAENTDLIIADADTIWLRSIPIGGNNFTETLVKSFKLNFAKAEDLKRNAATSKYARQIFQAMRPVFADLVAEVQRSIGFYASVHRDSRIKKIIAVGGTFRLPGLQKYLQQNLQLEVERLDTFGAGAPPDAKAAATYQDNILSLVSAYGLGLQAMGEGKITSSLLPARIRRERMWQEKTKFFGAAAALFAVGTGVGFASIFLNRVKYDSVADDRNKIQTVTSTAQGLDSRWTEISSKGGPDRQRILNIRSLTQYRDMLPQILADVQKAIPVLPGTPADIGKIKRSERKQVKLDSVSSQYYADLTPVADLKQFSGDAAGGGAQMPAGFGGAAGAGFGGAASEGAAGAGAGMPGMPMEAPGAPGGAAPAAAAAGATAAGHGFVVRIAGTTPFATAETLLDATLVKNLMATAKDKAGAKKPYRIEKVELAFLKKLELNQTKLQAIKSAYDAALQAKTTGTFTPTGGTGFPGFSGQPMEGDVGAGGGGFGGAPAFNPGAAAPGAAAQPGVPDPDAAYKDRDFPTEDIRADQEFVAYALVVVDPPPPTETPAAPADAGAAPAAGAAAPADTAAAPGAAPGATPAAAPTGAPAAAPTGAPTGAPVAPAATPAPAAH